MGSIGPRYRERMTSRPASIGAAGGYVVTGKLQYIWGANSPFPNVVNWEQELKFPALDHFSNVERVWDETHPGPPFTSGGPFTSVKAAIPSYDVQGHGSYLESDQLNSVDRYVKYTGGFGNPDFINDTSPLLEYLDVGLNQVDNPLFPDLGALGSEAYARLRPQIQVASLGVALAEAKDVPRMLQTTAHGFHDIWSAMGGSRTSGIMQPKWAADNFLNHQFGWVPFLKDLQDLDKLIQDFNKYATQAGRSNNTWQKRYRANKAVESETIIEASPTGYGVFPGNDQWMVRLYNGPPSCNLHFKSNTLVWYEGEFKYYRPEFDENVWWSDTTFGDIMRASTLSGVRVNPSVLWKATPWTWLADWMTNAGDVIQQVTDRAYDGVVSKYMYLMHHLIRTTTLRQELFFKTGGAKTFDWDRKIDIKRRQAADNSYGFHLSVESLNPGQLAILAALGLSRTG